MARKLSQTKKPKETAEFTRDEAIAAIRKARKRIIQGLIEKAEGGSCQHAKFLFEYAGLAPGSEEGAHDHKASLAEILLKEFSTPEPALDEELNATRGAADESV